MKLAAPLLLALLLSACSPDDAQVANQEPSASDSSSAPDSAASQSEGEVVAVVNGVNLTESRVSVYLKGLPPLHEGGREEVIDNMISTELVVQAARAAGMENELREDLAVARQAVLARSYLAEYLRENPVTDAELQARYDELSGQFAGRKEYLSSHILLESEDEAKAALAEIASDPSRFADIAREKSKDPGSGSQGGDLGWSAAESYVPPFAEALRGMQPGEVSTAPVQSQFGWHVIQLREVRDAPPPPMEGRLRQQIENDARNDKVRTHIEQLRASATVELKEAP